MAKKSQTSVSKPKKKKGKKPTIGEYSYFGTRPPLIVKTLDMSRNEIREEGDRNDTGVRRIYVDGVAYDTQSAGRVILSPLAAFRSTLHFPDPSRRRKNK